MRAWISYNELPRGNNTVGVWIRRSFRCGAEHDGLRRSAGYTRITNIQLMQVYGGVESSPRRLRQRVHFPKNQPCSFIVFFSVFFSCYSLLLSHGFPFKFLVLRLVCHFLDREVNNGKPLPAQAG